MNILERARAVVKQLRTLAERSLWDWRRCPQCGSTWTIKNGSYRRRPWTFRGREAVRVQRHLCYQCGRSYSEESAWLVRGSWYERAVHRCAVDYWMHGRMSLRRVAEFVRSQLGRQGRWMMWHLLDEPGRQERCLLSASTVHHWLDRCGREAQRSVGGQLEGVACSGQMGTDGLWARLRGGSKRVVLALVDSVSGLLWPPVVVKDEERAVSWRRLFERAQSAGLVLDLLEGITSDGAQGLVSYLRQALRGVHQQRCIWHLWRGLGGKIAQQVGRAVADLATEEAKEARKHLRGELVGLVRAIFDAPSFSQGEQALAKLAEHTLGKSLAAYLLPLLDAALVHLLPCHQGLLRVSPEWCWRDFRQRLSRGRNHGSEQRLERAALVWAIYHNFTPAQMRHERKRHYRHPGQSPLEVAGAPPGELSYLDALGV